MEPTVLPPESFQVDAGFVRDVKALEGAEAAQYEHALSDGDLLIAGWGANFDIDREDEAFIDGAFDRGLKAFLDGEATLCYHHKHDHVLGKVLDAVRVPGKGVRIVARVDNQPESSPLRHLYEQVKKGTLNGLSVGGFFKRVMTAAGPRIADVDLTEWSITGVPVGRRTNFGVVAQKALEDVVVPDGITIPQVDGEIRAEDEDQIRWALEQLGSVFDRISKRSTPDPVNQIIPPA